MKISREELLGLLRVIDLTKPEEIDCEEFLSAVSGYVEKLASGQAAPTSNADVLHHLKVCPECLEEFEALYEAYRDGF